MQDSDVPSTFGELTQPKWKGKLALTYPNDDDAITFLFSILINKYGWDWFETLVKQDVQWIRGTGEPANYLALAQLDSLAVFHHRRHWHAEKQETRRLHHAVAPDWCHLRQHPSPRER